MRRPVRHRFRFTGKGFRSYAHNLAHVFRAGSTYLGNDGLYLNFQFFGCHLLRKVSFKLIDLMRSSTR